MINFFVGLVGGMVLLLIGQRITVAYKSRDQHASEIEKVVERYLENERASVCVGFPGLLKAGVCTLRKDADIRKACQTIAKYTRTPLGKYHDNLNDIDLLTFFKLAKERNYDFLRSGNPAEIADELRSQKKPNHRFPFTFCPWRAKRN